MIISMFVLTAKCNQQCRALVRELAWLVILSARGLAGNQWNYFLVQGEPIVLQNEIIAKEEEEVLALFSRAC